MERRNRRYSSLTSLISSLILHRSQSPTQAFRNVLNCAKRLDRILVDFHSLQESVLLCTALCVNLRNCKYTIVGRMMSYFSLFERSEIVYRVCGVGGGKAHANCCIHLQHATSRARLSKSALK